MNYSLNIKKYTDIAWNLVASCYTGYAMLSKLFMFVFACLKENIKLCSTILHGTPDVNEHGDEQELQVSNQINGNLLNSNSNNNADVSDKTGNSNPQDGEHPISNVQEICSYGSVCGGLVGGLTGLLIAKITQTGSKGAGLVLFANLVQGICFGSLLGHAICGASASSDVDNYHQSNVDSMVAEAIVGAAGGAIVGASIVSYDYAFGNTEELESNIGLLLAKHIIGLSYSTSCLAGCIVGTANLVGTQNVLLSKQDTHYNITSLD